MRKTIKKYPFHGQMITVKQASDITNIPTYLLYNRVYKGMTLEEAVAYKAPRKRTIVYQGHEYTVRALANKYGLSASTLRYRLDSGLDLEKALTKKRVNSRDPSKMKRGSLRGCVRYDCLHQDGSGECQIKHRGSGTECEDYYDAYEYYFGNQIKWSKDKAGKDPWAEERKLLIG